MIDSSVIEELRSLGGDVGNSLLEKVLTLFADRGPPATSKVVSLGQDDDVTALADAVHGLKSMCGSIGARRAFAACHDLEHAARSGAVFDAGVLIARIQAEMTLALREAERLRAA